MSVRQRLFTPAAVNRFTLRDPDAAATEAICEAGIRLVPAGVPYPFPISDVLVAELSPSVS